jgi:hypothetical protein
MIQSVRPDGSFELVNHAWRDTLGYQDAEPADMIIWDIIHPDAVAHCQPDFVRAIEG